jgi:hypothetical protein
MNLFRRIGLAAVVMFTVLAGAGAAGGSVEEGLAQALKAFRQQLNPEGTKNLKAEQKIWDQRRDSLPEAKRPAFTRERTRELWGHYFRVRKETYAARRTNAEFRRADDRLLAVLKSLLAKPALKNPEALRADHDRWLAQRDECRLPVEEATKMTVERVRQLAEFSRQVDQIEAEMRPPEPPPEPAAEPAAAPEPAPAPAPVGPVPGLNPDGVETAPLLNGG